MDLDQSLDSAPEEWRNKVGETIRLWARRRSSDSRGGTDLEWYYRVSAAASDIGLDPRDGPTFACEACGGLADIIDAAEASFQLWYDVDGDGAALSSTVHAALTDEEIVRPATLQSLLGWSFEDANVALNEADRLGVLERKGNGYVLPKPRCSACIEHRARAAEAVAEARAVQALRQVIPAQLRFRVLQRDGFRCQYCGRAPADGAVLQLDHVVPVSSGGETTEDNLMTACETCNLGKGTRSVVHE